MIGKALRKTNDRFEERLLCLGMAVPSEKRLNFTKRARVPWICHTANTAILAIPTLYQYTFMFPL